MVTKNKKVGLYTGGTVSYGYRLLPGGTLEVDDDEMETIRTAHDLHAEGLSLRKIAARLHELGRTPKQSDRWHARTVQSLLRAQVAV